MKCANCGGNYKTSELICPYCNTENAIGRMWKAQRTEAELQYEAARKEAGKKASPYIIDRVLSRIMFSLIIVGAIVLLCAMLYFLGKDIYISSYQKFNKDKIEKQLDQYYQNYDFEGMEAYMDKYDLFFSEETYYEYRQVVIMYRDYQSYLEQKYKLLCMTATELDEATNYYELDMAVGNSASICRAEFGIYDEVHERNQALWKQYTDEIMVFWKATLGLTQEEIDWLLSEDNFYGEFDDEQLKTIIDRRAWLNE